MRFMASSICFLAAISFSFGTVMGQKQATATVYGRITDLWGNPLEGVELKFYRLRFKNDGSILVENVIEQNGITDRHGDYKLSNLLPGEYRVSVDLRGFRQAEVWRVSLRAGDENLLDIGLEVGAITTIPAIEIIGEVRQPDKGPLQDATVVALNVFNQQIIEQVRTDKVGRYKINLQAPGQYVIYAFKPGFAVTAKTVISREKQTLDFTLQLLR